EGCPPKLANPRRWTASRSTSSESAVIPPAREVRTATGAGVFGQRSSHSRIPTRIDAAHRVPLEPHGFRQAVRLCAPKWGRARALLHRTEPDMAVLDAESEAERESSPVQAVMSGWSVRLSRRDGHARAAQFSRRSHFVVNQTVHHVIRAA